MRTWIFWDFMSTQLSFLTILLNLVFILKFHLIFLTFFDCILNTAACCRRGFVFGLWSACASVGNILGAFLASSVLKYGYEVRRWDSFPFCLLFWSQHHPDLLPFAPCSMPSWWRLSCSLPAELWCSLVYSLLPKKSVSLQMVKDAIFFPSISSQTTRIV